MIKPSKQKKTPRRILYLSLGMLFSIVFQITWPVQATVQNFKLLPGEWSHAGKCKTERYVFTPEGKYMWLLKIGSKWKQQNSTTGIYLSTDKPFDNRITIADGTNMGGYLVDIYLISKTQLKGKWNTEMSDGLSFENPDDAYIDYIRCPKRS